MNDNLIDGVSDTAFWVAHHRAAESERPDALFRDPLADVMAGERGKAIAAGMPMRRMTAWVIAMRTCIIDDFVKIAISQGVDVVLNLGAGLDTRPYRMGLPESMLWIEADYPHVIDFKEGRLANEQPRCRLERVRLDLADLSERRRMLDAVNARAKKLLILTEGVLPYLSEGEVGSLANDLNKLDRVGFWIVDYNSPETFRFRKQMNRHMRKAPFKFIPKDWFGFFSEHGWQAGEIRYLAEESERLRRPIPLPRLIKVFAMIRSLFLSQEKHRASKRFAAYVLLQPTASTSV